jgi:hypothetical protein
MHSTDFVFTDEIPDRENPHPHVEELIIVHHNGDFSGTLIFNLETWRVDEAPFGATKRNDQNTCEVKVPFEVVAKLVAEAVLSKKISTLEEAEYREVLGL